MHVEWSHVNRRPVQLSTEQLITLIEANARRQLLPSSSNYYPRSVFPDNTSPPFMVQRARANIRKPKKPESEDVLARRRLWNTGGSFYEEGEMPEQIGERKMLEKVDVVVQKRDGPPIVHSVAGSPQKAAVQRSIPTTVVNARNVSGLRHKGSEDRRGRCGGSGAKQNVHHIFLPVENRSLRSYSDERGPSPVRGVGIGGARTRIEKPKRIEGPILSNCAIHGKSRDDSSPTTPREVKPAPSTHRNALSTTTRPTENRVLPHKASESRRTRRDAQGRREPAPEPEERIQIHRQFFCVDSLARRLIDNGKRGRGVKIDEDRENVENNEEPRREHRVGGGRDATGSNNNPAPSIPKGEDW